VTHEDAFLQAVIATPDDDTPRLVYADWLDEHGQSDRAEFIRVQCELARLPRDDPRREGLAAREQALLAAHEKEWSRPVRKLAEKWEFRGGVVEAVALAGDAFLGRAEKLFAAAPIRDATFASRWSDVPGTLARLAASPHVARLEAVGLSFSNFSLHDAGLQALASLPPLLERLDRLTAIICPITAAGVCPVLLSSHLRRLSSLHLSNTMIRGEEVGRALAESRGLGRLATLIFRGSTLGDMAVRWLADSDNCRSLENLALSNCDVGDVGAVALGRSPHLGRLRCLFLDSNTIGDTGVAALAGSARLAGLETLVLDRNPIGDAGAQALATSPHLGRLRALGLSDTRVTPAGVELLKARFGKEVLGQP
jgi:uncharacterized protein (TIGR02996 family)